jgi:DNA-directed RNA polymerase specialized sigma24 family protein
LPNFRGDSSERTFIFRIAHNRAISHIAKRKGYTGSDELEDVSDRRPDPETSLTSVQRHVTLGMRAMPREVELGRRDSNPDKQIQSPFQLKPKST